ncbi:MAG TPA: allantoate amidohydrolase [Candidatus Limnocylindrales bacterium]|nr:allantoate amidohydrolase [Candidatus Limnocylindrales bacterium]
MTDPDLGARFEALFAELAAIGRDPASGAYRRLPWTDDDRAARTWFARAAADRGLRVEADRNGNLWAWWGAPGRGAIASGSHLDSVPDGGAWDGALGIVAALLAIDVLREWGFEPARPIAIVAWVEEEGGRFGIPTLGSRLSIGLARPPDVLDRTDRDGVTMRDALTGAGIDVAGIGPDSRAIGFLAAFVELHIEQGRGLAGLGVPLGVGTGIWPHGRWQIRLTGAADHAGTTALTDRHDALFVLAHGIVAARLGAQAAGGVATVGRVGIRPNVSNIVPGWTEASLDVRAPDERSVSAIVDGVHAALADAAAEEGVEVELERVSWSAAVLFDPDLRGRVEQAIDRAGVPWAREATAAGHDAGILAGAVPTAMLFVRNPTGTSHAPDERADRDDAVAGIRALAAVLADLSA